MRMTVFSRGDIVLVGFIFSQESGKKLRPALVVSSREYNRARQELVVAAITSNVGRRLIGDHAVGDWKGAGLLFPSVVTGILRTIKRTMIDRRLGVLSKPDLEAVNRALGNCLGL
jgi:mRNA interferase MazF